MKAPDLPQNYKQRMDTFVLDVMQIGHKIWHIAEEFVVERNDRSVVLCDNKITIVIRESTPEEVYDYERELIKGGR